MGEVLKIIVVIFYIVAVCYLLFYFGCKIINKFPETIKRIQKAIKKYIKAIKEEFKSLKNVFVKKGSSDIKKISISDVCISEETIEDKSNRVYHKKKLRTPCEEKFYEKLQAIVDTRQNRVLQAQIPLSSIVKKQTTKTPLELYRTIDFGIFDDYGDPLVMIELNDMSHLEGKRRYRDYKVRSILEDAGIPLVTFWTDKPNEIRYIVDILWDYL